MKQQFEHIKKELQSALQEVKNFADLEVLENKYFSRKSGQFSTLMKGMKDLSVEMKKEVGQFANSIKQDIDAAVEKKKLELEEQKWEQLAKEEGIDVTQQIKSKKRIGHVHPITQARQKMEDIATSMGFRIEDGPELESDYFVFGALNFPDDHPARESMDTFYIKDDATTCMRAHVSNMQVRLMRKYNEGGTKPVRLAYPGRVYRNEAIDATHEHTFYQWESLVVAKQMNIGNMIAVIQEMLQGVFEKKVKVRVRPSYFPFVEPGLEMDMKVDYGKGEKWLEMLGCGLIHPNVLREAGYDPNEWQGFAYAFGIDRLVIAKYGIEDIRHFHSGDLRFLSQF